MIVYILEFLVGVIDFLTFSPASKEFISLGLNGIHDVWKGCHTHSHAVDLVSDIRVGQQVAAVEFFESERENLLEYVPRVVSQ